MISETGTCFTERAGKERKSAYKRLIWYMEEGYILFKNRRKNNSSDCGSCYGRKGAEIWREKAYWKK